MAVTRYRTCGKHTSSSLFLGFPPLEELGLPPYIAARFCRIPCLSFNVLSLKTTKATTSSPYPGISRCHYFFWKIFIISSWSTSEKLGLVNLTNTFSKNRRKQLDLKDKYSKEKTAMCLLATKVSRFLKTVLEDDKTPNQIFSFKRATPFLHTRLQTEYKHNIKYSSLHTLH